MIESMEDLPEKVTYGKEKVSLIMSTSTTDCKI